MLASFLDESGQPLAGGDTRRVNTVKGRVVGETGPERARALHLAVRMSARWCLSAGGDAKRAKATAPRIKGKGIYVVADIKKWNWNKVGLLSESRDCGTSIRLVSAMLWVHRGLFHVLIVPGSRRRSISQQETVRKSVLIYREILKSALNPRRSLNLAQC